MAEEHSARGWLNVVVVVISVVAATTGILAYRNSIVIRDIDHALTVNDHLDRAQDLLAIPPGQTLTTPPQVSAQDLSTAEREVRDALTLKPGDRRALALDAVLTSLTSEGREGGSADCEAKFKQLLRRESSYVYSYILYADYLITRERYSNAIPIIRDGLRKIDPAQPLLRNQLAVCLLRTGHNQEAIRILRELNEGGPCKVSATNVPALVNLGFLLVDDQEFVQAEALFERAAELEPHNAEVLRHLGAIYLTNGRLQEAERALSRALELGLVGDLAETARDNLLDALSWQGKDEEAAELQDEIEARKLRKERLSKALTQS